MPSLSSLRACASRQTVISLTGISRRRYAIAERYVLRGLPALRAARRGLRAALAWAGRRLAAGPARLRDRPALGALRAPLADLFARANGQAGGPFYLKSDWLAMLD